MIDNRNLYNSPLEGRTSKVIFILLVLFGLLVTIGVCSDSLGFTTSTRHLVLSVFVAITVCGLFAFTGSDASDEFFVVSVVSLLFVSLLVAMTQSESRIAFWLTFLLIISTAALDALEYKKDFWENLLSSLYVVWIVAGVFITLGNTSYFPYAKPIEQFSKIHPLLEIRFLVSIILLALSVVYAVNRAFREKKPDIPLIRKPKLQDISGGIHTIFRPIVQVLQVILSVLLEIGINIANFIWLGIAKFAAYVVRTGRNLGSHFLNLLLNGKIWKAIIRVLFSFILTLCFTGFILPMMPRFIDYYLRNAYPFYSIHWGSIVSLVKIGGLVLLTFLCIVLIHSLWQSKKGLSAIRDQGTLGLTFILVALFLSGLIMYSLTYFREIIKINIIGFSSLGLFSFIALVFLGAGFLFVIKREIQERQPYFEPVKSDVKHKYSEQPAVASNENRWVLAILSSILFIGVVVILFPRLSNVQDKIDDANSAIQRQTSIVDTLQVTLKAGISPEKLINIDSTSQYRRNAQKHIQATKTSRKKKKGLDTTLVLSKLRRTSIIDTSSFNRSTVSLDSAIQLKKSQSIPSVKTTPEQEGQKIKNSKSLEDSVKKSIIPFQKSLN